jgi:hypothetical protein
MKDHSAKMGLVHHSLRSECSAAMTGKDGRPYLATSAKEAQSFKAYSADRFKEKFFSYPFAYRPSAIEYDKPRTMDNRREL